MSKITLKFLPLTMVHVKGNETIQDFWIAEAPVTQELWEIVMGSNPSYFKNCPQCPVETVSWDDIVNEFLPKLNQMTGQNYRLPTETEWEYAARGGNQSKGFEYANGDNIVEVAWCYDNSNNQIQPVKKKKPNELGLYDMCGNVWEWCSDLLPESTYRVNRGGSWYITAQYCRVSFRNNRTPGFRFHSLGFRLAC